LPVNVELFGGLKNNLPRRQTVILQKPITVDEFIRRLKLNTDEIGLIVIDGVQKELDDLVPTTCRLCFFPPVSGGAIEITFKEE
jgi:molybdopterin converting factor small subunit